MNIKPVSYSEATGTVRDNYHRICKAFGIGYLPLFFQYFGPFPEYLDYITRQIISVLENRKFNTIVNEVGDAVVTLMKEQFPHSDKVTEWESRYRYSPQYFNFQDDMKRIYQSNVKLLILFIALREAVKGWAVAAKKLEPHQSHYPEDMQDFIPMTAKEEKNIIFEDTMQYYSDSPIRQITLSKPSVSMQAQPNRYIEKDLLIDYMHLCRIEYYELTKKADFLIFRVEAEKMVLHTLPLLPEPIFSPINVVLQYVSRYGNYSELLYLLSEHFPQLTVQKTLFSAYML